MTPLKLYVWENVLEDWTSGIMFALAPDVRTARNILIEKWGGRTMVDYKHSDFYRDVMRKPRVVKDPEGFYLYGGG